ncbi:hypothetical protein CS549_02285 [Porphyromonas gingivalis]|uniref:hypothetical protein n=1 Tax=Porphyromonas gingivalis TaxID=837 RepID=UPI000C18B311|nr:hypothetical protein [Porphyromonas gingivalis]ATS00001.1 hypothetical protein CS549_02285 [Porphyromonas gingivalis]
MRGKKSDSESSDSLNNHTPKKVFNNEDEFGTIPNKHLRRKEKRGKSSEEMNFHGLKYELKQAGQRSVYKAFSICIQIVSVLYINRF